MDNQQYDVVVVGAGIAGAVLCKVLTNAGQKVLLLEAGLQAGMALDSEKDYENYQSYLERFYANTIKATNTPYPNVKDAPSIDVLEIQAQTPYSKDSYLVQMGPIPFASDCLRAPGGTTLHWLGNVPRMLPNDFNMKSLYNVGVDWPIDYQDLVPYYEMAENEIGVSGDVKTQVGPDMNINNYGQDYVFPMLEIPQSYQDQYWIKHSNGVQVELNGEQYTINCISMPQGRNSHPNNNYRFDTTKWCEQSQKLVLEHTTENYEVVGATWASYTGERCEGNASCVPICPVQAKYNALKTLKKSDFNNLEISTQSVASKINVDDNGDVTSVMYKKYQHADNPAHTEHQATGKIYVLACSAIENAKLLLASGIANHSDQVGRNLMDHQVLLTWGLLPEKVYPYRGPGCTTYIPTFRDGDFRAQHAAWISPIDNWGWSWPTFAPGTDVTDAVVNEHLFGQALKTKLNDKITRQALLHFECEQAPNPRNRVTIDEQYKDTLGNYRPVIHYHSDDYMGASFAAAKHVSDQIFAANNITDFTEYKPDEADYVEYQGQGYTFRGAGHIVGTHRMGSHRDTSVVDKNQRCWDHSNLYLTGCGNMPTLGTSNPTLTMTALTFAAAESILQQLSSPKCG